MSGDITVLAVEICSGPLDGTGVQVPGSSFTVGHDGSCSVSLPEIPGTPAKAVMSGSVNADGGLTLEAECDLEYEGATTKTAAASGDMLVVRVGATDLAVSIVASEGQPAEPASAGEVTEDKKTCPKCGSENAAAARWCTNCGRDL